MEPQEEDRVPGTRTRLDAVEQGWCRAARRKSSAVLVPSAESRFWAQTDAGKVTRFVEKLALALNVGTASLHPCQANPGPHKKRPHTGVRKRKPPIADWIPKNKTNKMDTSLRYFVHCFEFLTRLACNGLFVALLIW